MNEIKIGNQIWTSQNSQIKQFRNGDLIPQVSDYKLWQETKEPAWCFYDNDPLNENNLGILYNGYAIFDSRNLAPEGFRIPSIQDFEEMIKFLGSIDSGHMLKTKSKGFWKNMKGVNKGTDEFGFNAYPTGLRTTTWGEAPFVNKNEYTRFWTLTRKENEIISCVQLGYGDNRIYTSGSIHSNTRITDGCSLRFIKE